jgi:hypothetical protein
MTEEAKLLTDPDWLPIAGLWVIYVMTTTDDPSILQAFPNIDAYKYITPDDSVMSGQDFYDLIQVLNGNVNPNPMFSTDSMSAWLNQIPKVSEEYNSMLEKHDNLIKGYNDFISKQYEFLFSNLNITSSLTQNMQLHKEALESFASDIGNIREQLVDIANQKNKFVDDNKVSLLKDIFSQESNKLIGQFTEQNRDLLLQISQEYSIEWLGESLGLSSGTEKG